MAVDEGAGERDLAWLLDDLASRVTDFRERSSCPETGCCSRRPRTSSGSKRSTCRRSPRPCKAWRRAPASASSAGGVRQTVIELERGLLFVIAAGEGSCLAALCPADADAGMVAYEMAMLVKRARPHLISHARFPVRATARE